jgi:hypothetical protein
VRIGLLEHARASFAQRSWGDAYAQFATADAATPLDLDDLEKLALAAYLTGHDEESTLAGTRAPTTKPSIATIHSVPPGTPS